MSEADKITSVIDQSDLVSRDLSWLKFNYRVLDQARHIDRNIFEKLKFMAITSSNLDEFFMIRVGSLYNYLDYKKDRVDYCGLREEPFKKKLFEEIQQFVLDQVNHYMHKLKPQFAENGFVIGSMADLDEEELKAVKTYFKKTIFPMLTPMVYDSYHTFPVLMNKFLIFSVITSNAADKSEKRKLSFIQIPKNLPRFFVLEKNDKMYFIPVEEIIRANINKLFRNVEIEKVTLLRITRNGDFTLDESDDIEANFLEELKRKLKSRRTGRAVRIEIEEDPDPWLLRVLLNKWELERENIFIIPDGCIFDFTSLFQIVGHDAFKSELPTSSNPIPPLNLPQDNDEESIFDILKERDILLHHPYNSIEPLLDLLEKSAEDPKVLSIKLTIYRLANDSRVTAALLKAAENGKHVSVLFEVKARFDEENNLSEAKRLQEAGCFVIYGINNVKTHTKLLLIVRKEGEKVTRYLHMSTGNYNENTAKLYSDIGLLTTNSIHAHDVSEFFNAITGHSEPNIYQHLITAPKGMREQLIGLIRAEAENAKQGLPCGIAIKCNSLQDKHFINELYAASQAGVKIKLIIRGMCCLRPGRKGLSENIEVYSIVGDYLEHSRIYYFHNVGDPKIYSGSADVMVRSFDRRIESLFLITNDVAKQECINVLNYNLRDNVNAYIMNEDSTYTVKTEVGQPKFNIFKEFYNVDLEDVMSAKLF